MTAFRRTHGSAWCEEPGLTHQLSVCLGPRVGEKTLINNECKKAALRPERGGSARHVVTQEQGWTLTANYEKPLERERVDPPSASRAHREDSSSAHELERLQPVERCCGKWDVPDYCGHGSSAFHTADRHRPSCVHLQETGSVSRLLHSAKHHRGLSSGMEEDGRDQHQDKEGVHWRTLTTDLPHEETPDRAGRVPLESPCRPQRDTTISEDSVEEGTKQKKRAVKKKTAAVRAAPETSSRVLRPRKQLKVEPTAVAEEKSRKRKYVKQRAVKSSTGAPEKKRPGRKMTPLLLEIPPELLKKPRVKTDFHCAVCGRTFPHAYKLERHQLIHTGERPYCCSICGRGFNQKGNLKTHYKVHLGHKGSLDYDDLSPISPDLCEYLKSLPGESRVSSLRCLECGKDCESQSALQAHHITMHSPKSAATEPPFYFCRRCGIEFKEKYQLEDHMKTHVKEKPYSCPDCGKRFINQNYIAVHQRIHTGERPYLCSQCGRGFHTSSSLKLHETQHSGERPFGCSVCGKRFRVKSYLSTHYQTHLNDRPFICSVCGKGYSRAEELKVHSRLHTGERPYRCGECGKSFIYRQGLRQHQRTHAGRRMGPTRQLGRPKQQARLDS